MRFPIQADTVEKHFGWKCAFSLLFCLFRSSLVSLTLFFVPSQTSLSSSTSATSLGRSLSWRRRVESSEERGRVKVLLA